jgi:deoxyribonuclease-4
MGKINQLGTVDEIIRLCNIDDIVIPCVDFGHVNARENGILHSYEDFKKVIDKFRNGIGVEKTNNMHIHFSHIQYSAKGEIRHLNFDDIIYGPFFEPLCDVLIDYNMTPCVLCESAGNQAEDALSMRNIYLEKTKKVNINE